MIFKNKTEIVGIYKSKTPIQAIYHYGVLIWQAVRSCFGSGMWFNDKPWINDEIWKNE